ncbi:hypothetical protein HAV15_012365 [Penicillium sp. str. |nr:hypothetical protein HAV15_012365 [Penicillium sp. str. \
MSRGNPRLDDRTRLLINTSRRAMLIPKPKAILLQLPNITVHKPFVNKYPQHREYPHATSDPRNRVKRLIVAPHDLIHTLVRRWRNRCDLNYHA